MVRAIKLRQGHRLRRAEICATDASYRSRERSWPIQPGVAMYIPAHCRPRLLGIHTIYLWYVQCYSVVHHSQLTEYSRIHLPHIEKPTASISINIHDIDSDIIASATAVLCHLHTNGKQEPMEHTKLAILEEQQLRKSP